MSADIVRAPKRPSTRKTDDDADPRDKLHRLRAKGYMESFIKPRPSTSRKSARSGEEEASGRSGGSPSSRRRRHAVLIEHARSIIGRSSDRDCPRRRVTSRTGKTKIRTKVGRYGTLKS